MPTEHNVSAEPRAAGLLETVKTARDSLGRMAFELDLGEGQDASDAAAVIREAQQVLQRLADETPEGKVNPGTTGALYFDVSDLLGYYPHNRLPTGIQRVQINTILNLLDAPGGREITLCRFVEERDEWRAVPISLFRSVCQLSMAGGDALAAEWQVEVARLDGAIASGPALIFPQSACLVNLGTSWWLPNYFMYIRQAKIASQIRYVPLIHDMIPAILPDYCNAELVHEFIDWLVGVLQHADFFLCVSESTKSDLIRLARELGREIPDDQVAVVPLAAELNSAAVQAEAARVSLAKWHLAPASFVLFVSTIEARKNQLAAFEAWQKLMSRHGRDKIPQLVCVGKRGYKSDEAYTRLELSPDLQGKVTILDKVNDAELEALYRNCLFTIYPSIYEGWGLPVTESLCHNKVPVVANNSSLPQAGGGYSVEFETGSLAGFVEALERMTFDADFRRSKEAAIANHFVARTWQDVAADIGGRVRELAGRDVGGAEQGWQLPAATPGYYPMVRNREYSVRAGLGSAEIFRHGTGWWRLEDEGCWTKPGGGELVMRLGSGPQRIAFELVGLPDYRANYSITTHDAVWASGAIEAEARKWVFVDVPAGETDRDVRIRIASVQSSLVIQEIDEETELSRDIGIGIGGFFVFDLANPRARLDFVEAVALGSLTDHKVDLRFQ